MVVLDVLLAVAGLVVLTVAADQLVLGSSRLARRLRISPVVVGVAVIGLGTSAPEFVVSGLAAARGDAGIAVGNLVGSNILNLTLLLGVAAVICPIPVASAVVRREVPLAVAAVVLFAALVVVGVGLTGAVVLAVAAVAALWVLVRWARNTPVETPLAEDVREFVAAGGSLAGSRGWREPVRAVVGLLGVLAGAQMLVDGAAAVAVRFGVPQVVIGYTLVAFGTSLPELVTSVQAQRRGESDLVVGNLFGSNLFNSLVGGAVIGFGGAAAPERAGVLLVVAMVVSAGLAWALLWRGLRLTRWEGVALLATYASMTPLVFTS